MQLYMSVKCRKTTCVYVKTISKTVAEQLLLYSKTRLQHKIYQDRGKDGKKCIQNACNVYFLMVNTQ